MSNIKITDIKWGDSTVVAGHWGDPFTINVNEVVCTGHIYYRFRSTPPAFVVKFDNKLISKHPEYKNIRSNLLASFKDRYNESPTWFPGAIKSFERANIK